jgi:monothiol glutaredoxin
MHPDRPLLPASRRTDVVKAQEAAFHRDYVDEVIAAVDTHDVVVVGMGQNPVVKKAREALSAAEIAYFYVGHGNYFTGYRRRLAVKMWSGYPTFPQVFVKGVLVGGCTELVRGLADGSLRARLAAPRPPSDASG